ncbi:MAG: winged helix-turn-helix transcriptional regulator [Chelatococcus sp.]|nr:winged helix-turn-helix transcriptional regulator [Chelatococcus sp.]
MAWEVLLSGRNNELTVSRPELLRNGSDSVFRQFIHDTLAFASRIEQISSRFGKVIGLTGTQYLILIAIRQRQSEEIGVNQIAEHLHLSGAFTTIEVNKLVSLGLVRKEINPDDRRRVVLSLTDDARARLKKLIVVQRPTNDVLFESLGAKDFERLVGQMAALVESADKSLVLLDYLSQTMDVAASS